MYIDCLPTDFNWRVYINKNPDLSNMNKIQAENHYKKFGFREKRKFTNDLPKNFNWKVYIKHNPDLGSLSKKKAEEHFKIYGIYEKRKYTNCLPNDFTWEIYIKLNPDIGKLSKKNAEQHYIENGIYEKRNYGGLKYIYYFYNHNFYKKIVSSINSIDEGLLHYHTIGRKENIPCYFKNENFLDINLYLEFYPDVSKSEFYLQNPIFHYIDFGKNENRILNKFHLARVLTKNYLSITNQNNLLKNTNFVNKEKLINILIRTSNRPRLFNKCIKSILSQNYYNYNIITCYDTIDSENYLKKYDHIVNFKKFYIHIESDKKYKFNLYCNHLIDKVKDGIICFIDDDNMYTHNFVLKSINENFINDDDFLIWTFMRPDKLIYTQDKIELGNIDTSSFCFHSKYKNLASWGDEQYGDYSFTSTLINKHKFNMKIIPGIFTKTIEDTKIGNWGN